MAMVHAVEDDTHALPCCNQRRDTDEEANERNDTPCTTSAAAGEDDGDDETSEDAEDAESAREDDTRPVTIADSPTDEVGVCLASERPLDCRHDVAKGRRMSRVLESMEQ